MTQTPIELPFSAWPEIDRAAWADLFRIGDPLDGQGAAVHWSEATRHTNRKHYARWLAWLAANDLLDPGPPPAERATPARIEAYVRSMMTRLAPRTVASALIGLKCVLQRLAPDGDWQWLKTMTNRLDRWAIPSRGDPVAGLSAPRIFSRLLADLDQRAGGPLERRRDQIMFRDTLIVAILIACPIRLRNVAMMRLGAHLHQVGCEWHLRFEDSETKTGQPIHLVLPVELSPVLAVYFDKVRSAFPGAADHRHLWPACKGKPMAMETIYMRVVKRSRNLFGVALNPHAFRSLAATFLAESSPEDALYARPLLGHRQPQTTEKHYIRASQMAASRAVTTALRSIRDA